MGFLINLSYIISIVIQAIGLEIIQKYSMDINFSCPRFQCTPDSITTFTLHYSSTRFKSLSLAPVRMHSVYLNLLSTFYHKVMFRCWNIPTLISHIMFTTAVPSWSYILRISFSQTTHVLSIFWQGFTFLLLTQSHRSLLLPRSEFLDQFLDFYHQEDSFMLRG